MQLTLLDAIGHLSFGLTAVSFYVRDILLLRSLAILSGLVGIAYNYSIPSGPLWLVIFWLAVFIAINVARIVGLVLARRSIDLSEEEAELHETVFQALSPVEFMKLLRIGEWKNAEVGHHFTEQGEAIDGLMVLYSGEVAIERDDKEIDRARDGTIIGDFSFIRGGAATATVSALQPCCYLYWTSDALRGLLRRNPAMDVAMRHIFNVELTRKLLAPRQGQS